MGAAFVSNTWLPPMQIPRGIGTELESAEERSSPTGHWDFFCRPDAQGILHEHVRKETH